MGLTKASPTKSIFEPTALQENVNPTEDVKREEKQFQIRHRSSNLNDRKKLRNFQPRASLNADLDGLDYTD